MKWHKMGRPWSKPTPDPGAPAPPMDETPGSDAPVPPTDEYNEKEYEDLIHLATVHKSAEAGIAAERSFCKTQQLFHDTKNSLPSRSSSIS